MKKSFILLVTLLSLLSSCGTSEVPLSHQENSKQNKTKVILLAGGDNCLGYSYSYHLQDFNMNISDEKMEEYREGYDNVKILYKNMYSTHLVNRELDNFENVRLGQGRVANEAFLDGNIGPELGIAEYLSPYYSNEDVYILKFAGANASSLYLEWNVDAGLYYQKMINFFDKGLDKIKNITENFEISAFCFMQGESDSRYFSDTYSYYLSSFVNSVKERYYEYAPSNGMAFIDAGISSYYLNHSVINGAKKVLADSDGRNYYIDTIAADIHNDKDNTDRKHFDAMGMLKLGNLFGRNIKNSIEYKNKNVIDNSLTGEVVYNENFGDYKLSAISNGEYAYSQWNFTKSETQLNINVQVEDKYIYNEDSVEIMLSDFSDVAGISYGTLKVKAYHNGEVEVSRYNNYEFINYNKLDIVNKNKYIKNGEAVTGYQLNISILMEDDLGISFALINDNEKYVNRKVYSEFKTNDQKTKTYMTLNNNLLNYSPYLENGNSFGDIPLFERSGTWDLSQDDGVNNKISLTNPNYDSKIFMYNKKSNKLSVEMDFTATKVVNYDYYGKFGIKITSINGNGIAFYVDAWGNGKNMYGTQLGYVTYTNNINNNDYTLIDYYLNDFTDYQNGNNITLGIIRNVDVYSFTCNGETILELFDPAKIGNLDAYMGVWSCNIGVEVSSYLLTTF